MSGAALAIDSVSDCVVVAFSGEDGVPVLKTHSGRQDHSQVLLQMVNAVCAGRQDALEAIVVVRGPGAYTGVRVGLATAQGLSVALDAPVYGVGTLEAVARSAREIGVTGPLTAIHPAGRGDFAAQHFDEANAPGVMELVRAEELAGLRSAGEGANELGGFEISPEQRCMAALQQYRDGEVGPAEALYVREPHITLARKASKTGALAPKPAPAPQPTEE